MFQLHDKVDTFRQAVRDGDATPPLELTADELNALIATGPGVCVVEESFVRDNRWEPVRGANQFSGGGFGFGPVARAVCECDGSVSRGDQHERIADYRGDSFSPGKAVAAKYHAGGFGGKSGRSFQPGSEGRGWFEEASVGRGKGREVDYCAEEVVVPPWHLPMCWLSSDGQALKSVRVAAMLRK